jgi:hypothetical protein
MKRADSFTSRFMAFLTHRIKHVHFIELQKLQLRAGLFNPGTLALLNTMYMLIDQEIAC